MRKKVYSTPSKTGLKVVFCWLVSESFSVRTGGNRSKYNACRIAIYKEGYTPLTQKSVLTKREAQFYGICRPKLRIAPRQTPVLCVRGVLNHLHPDFGWPAQQIRAACSLLFLQRNWTYCLSSESSGLTARYIYIMLLHNLYLLNGYKNGYFFK